ncbi:MAG: MarR family transcriptional regulator [Lachnospiraceae bacterium]|nr:MarR family transcriptional regulator [Lachnospiraceae bacterium]
MKYKVADCKEEVDFGDMDNTFFLIGLLNEFMNRFQTVGDSFFEEISWKQCFAIVCLGFFEQPPSLKELSELMGSSHQNVKQLLLKLERAGFVTFVADESDRRVQRIVVTEKTKEFNQKNDAPSADFMKQLFEDVDRKDLEVTIKTIMQMDDKLKILGEQFKKAKQD